jgi:hypothetical protein
MRSHPIRNVLRGLIAAGLLAAGANVSYGHSAVRHYSLSHACFLNDFDSDSHLGLHRNQGQESLFAAIETERLDQIHEIQECERAAALHDARSRVNAFLNHRVPRISNELLFGFRTGFSWVGLVAKTRNSVISQWNGALLKLADIVGQVQSTELEPTSVGIQANIFVYRFEDESNGSAIEMDVTVSNSLPNQLAVAELHPDDRAAYNSLQTGMDPICNEWQKCEPKDPKYLSIANSCSIVEDNSYLEEITVVQSQTLDASEEVAKSEVITEGTLIAESNRAWEEPARPPILEGDSTPKVASNTSTDYGHCGLGHCAIESLGHCAIENSAIENSANENSANENTPNENSEPILADKEHDLLSDVPNYLGDVERLPIDEMRIPHVELPLVYDRNVIDCWTATDWNVKHWYFKSQSHTSTGLFYSSPHKRIYNDLAMATGSPVSGVLDQLPIDPALIPNDSRSLYPETDIVEYPSFFTVYTPGPWFSDLISSTTDFAKSQWKLWRPTMEKSRKQTNRITANHLRNIGMFFLKSASLFDTTGFDAEVAGRDQTQR